MSEHTLAERLRPQFPVFERRVAGRPIAFFDGPGGSQVPAAVAEAVSRYLTHHNANTHGRFATSEESDAAVLAGRAAVADFVGATSPREVVFGANMTTLAFALSRALGRAWKGRGGEVVVTELDHQANVAPWRAMAEEHGMRVRVVPLDRETLTLDYGALEALLGPETRLVAVGAASNAVGTVNDVRRVTAAARAVGALSFVDAVHFAPHRRVDVAALGCDFLACSAYKFFGPHVGVLWGRRVLLEELEPFKVPPAGNEAPERWETGTQNHEGIAGTAAAVDWIAALGPEPGAHGRPAALDAAFAVLHAHESRLFARLWDGLGDVVGVRRYGLPADGDRTPTAAFTVAGRTPEEVAEALGRAGVFVWNGNFYASTVTAALGVEESGGLVRAGIAPYCTDDDVDRLLEGVARLAQPG
jgi:cysteine desulfurase family protein (TIGR01976 family)